MPLDEPVPLQPARRVRYYLGRAEDALDSSAIAVQEARLVGAGWREEFLQDLVVLRSKLDVLRALMNGR
jgi:hypothetical protein